MFNKKWKVIILLIIVILIIIGLIIINFNFDNFIDKNEGFAITVPSTTLSLEQQKINLINYQTINKNKHVINNYNKIVDINNDINKLGIEIRQKINQLNKINHTEDFPIGSSIKSIKSVMEGAKTVLSLNPTSEKNNYQVNINGQCLSVYSKDSVMLKPCQMGAQISDSQKFETIRIQTPLAAQSVMNNTLTNLTIKYPYNIFRSSMTGQCISLNDNNDVILKDCSPDNIRQQWKISPNETFCPIDS